MRAFLPVCSPLTFGNARSSQRNTASLEANRAAGGVVTDALDAVRRRRKHRSAAGVSERAEEVDTAGAQRRPCQRRDLALGDTALRQLQLEPLDGARRLCLGRCTTHVSA